MSLKRDENSVLKCRITDTNKVVLTWFVLLQCSKVNIICISQLNFSKSECCFECAYVTPHLMYQSELSLKLQVQVVQLRCQINHKCESRNPFLIAKFGSICVF